MEDSPELKPCWSISPSDEAVSSKGYVTFYLTNGPEYHISQITDAVMVAKHLGATFVLPDIRGSKPGDERTLKISSSLELQPGILEKKNCRETGAVVGSKTCYNAQEIALFLRKLGFESDTTIYLTQPMWESSLNILSYMFAEYAHWVAPLTSLQGFILWYDVRIALLMTPYDDKGCASFCRKLTLAVIAPTESLFVFEIAYADLERLSLLCILVVDNAEKRLCEAEGACQDSVNLALAAKVDLAKVQAEVERLHVKICSIEIARKFLEDKSKVEIVRRTCHVDFLGFMGRLEVKKSPLIARVESMEEIFLDDQDLDTSSDEAFVSPGCVADSIVLFLRFSSHAASFSGVYVGFAVFTVEESTPSTFGFCPYFHCLGLRKSWVLRNASLTARDFPMCELIDPLSDLPELDPRSSGRFSPANSNWREERLSALKRARQFLLLGCFPYYLVIFRRLGSLAH
ncbi:hypothetical protein Bca4012_065167 [Brassica carinata]